MSDFKTTLVKQTYEFRWTIENYPLSLSNSAYKVTSPEFHPAKKLTFYATLETEGDCDQIEISFFLKSKNDIKIKHEFSIEDVTGTQLYEDDEPQFHTYIYGSEPFVVSTLNTFDLTVLIFKCKMEFFLPSTDVEPTDLQQSLVGDFKAMYDNSLHADLKLKVDGSTVRVHKSVLSARSPVFAKMIASPMDEKEKNVIKIVDLKLPVLKGLLQFLYTEIMSDYEFEYVCDLYYAADKYDVPTLRKKCMDVLLCKLDVENACQVLSLADRHSDVQFKDSVMDFIRDQFDEIQETDSWAEFLDEEPTLAAEVMQ